MNASHQRSWTDPFARWGTKYTGRVLLLGLLLSAIGLWGTMQLKVDADLKALLPRDHDTITRLDELSRRMGAQTELMVSIESPSREANLRFGEALSQRMREFKELRFVQFHRDPEFFKDRALLYLPTKDLLELRRKVVRRIREETERELTGNEEEPAPKDGKDGKDGKDDDVLDLDEKELQKRYLGGNEAPDEYYEAEEGQVVVVKARPTEATTNVDFARALVERTEALIKELGPTSYHAGMTATVQGEYVQRVGETSGARRDVMAGAAFAVGLLLLVIGLYFRRAQAVPIIMLPVIASTLVTQAVGAFTYGSYNLVTVFIFAIVLGLGIEFGIHTLARYAAERERGLDVGEALRICLASTGDAVTTGGVTTLSVFFALALGEFRGFSQFGIMAGIGIFLSLVFTFLLMPALVAGFDRWFPWKKGGFVPGGNDNLPPGPPSRRGVGLARTILAISVFYTGISVYGFLQGRVPFEYDFTKLEAKKKPQPVPAGPPPKERKNYKDAVGRVTTFAPAVTLCETMEQCGEVTRTLAAVKKLSDRDVRVMKGELAPLPPEPYVPLDAEEDAGDEEEDADEDDPFAKRRRTDPFEALEKELAEHPLSPTELALVKRLGLQKVEWIRYYLQGYLSLYTFVPDDQEKKLEIIADIRRRIDDKRGAFPEDTRKKVDDFHRYLEVSEVITPESLPTWVKEQLIDAEGKLGRFIILWNRGAKANYNESKELFLSFFDFPVSAAGQPMGSALTTTVPTAANYFVLVDVIDTLTKDGPVVLSAAVLVVLLCLIVFFRSLGAALVTLLPLVMAITWLAGLHWLFDWKVNLYSIIAFPLLVGMSIDQGVHVYHRWRESPNLAVVMRETGAANVLTTLTTVIGFGGLWFADNLGIRSLGTTASVGTVLGLIGSCATLPALLLVLDRVRRRG